MAVNCQLAWIGGDLCLIFGKRSDPSMVMALQDRLGMGGSYSTLSDGRLVVAIPEERTSHVAVPRHGQISDDAPIFGSV